MFKKPSVDAVLGAFKKTLAGLAEVQEHHEAAAQAANVEAHALLAKSSASRAEADRANRIAAKLNDLIEGA